MTLTDVRFPSGFRRGEQRIFASAMGAGFVRRETLIE